MRHQIMVVFMGQIKENETLMDHWSERAAIREYDGGLEREEAEWLAMLDVLAML